MVAVRRGSVICSLAAVRAYHAIALKNCPAQRVPLLQGDAQLLEELLLLFRPPFFIGLPTGRSASFDNRGNLLR